MQFSKSHQNLIFHIGVLAISLFSLSRREGPLQESTFFQRVLIEAVAPVQGHLLNLKYFTQRVIANYFTLVRTNRDNQVLIQEVKQLQSQIFSLSEVTRENERLKKLLQFKEESDYQKVLARVVSWDSSGKYDAFRINKGERDGLKLQMAVVTASGLVGQIYRVTPGHSDVLTIVDPSSRVDALMSKTRSHGVLEGQGDYSCAMKYVTRNDSVELNDPVITSGLSSVFPKGILIGYVKKIERESYGVTQNIIIKPSVDFKKIEEVVVLVTDTKVEDGSP